MSFAYAITKILINYLFENSFPHAREKRSKILQGKNTFAGPIRFCSIFDLDGIVTYRAHTKIYGIINKTTT